MDWDQELEKAVMDVKERSFPVAGKLPGPTKRAKPKGIKRGGTGKRLGPTVFTSGRVKS